MPKKSPTVVGYFQEMVLFILWNVTSFSHVLNKAKDAEGVPCF